ncbi:MAG: M56 family metallopeptidase, partial [Bacteroidota bacterium]
MRSLLIYNLEVFLCLAVFYLFYQVSLKKETNHHFIRTYLMSSLIFSFAIPFLNLGLFSVSVSEVIPTVHIPEFAVNANSSEEVSGIQILTENSWLIFYSTICIFLFIGLMREFLKIVNVKGNASSEIEFFEGYKVIIHKTKFPTFSFMKTIYLSFDDLNPENSKQKILLHELSHIKGAHSIDILLIEVIRIVFWFNPMVYLYKSALTLSHEYIADQYSVERGDPQNYVNLLVNQTLSNLGLSLGSHFGRKSGILSEWPWARSFSFNKSQTLKRIKMIKNKRKMNKLKYLIPVLAVVIAAIVVSCVEDDNLTEIEEQASESTAVQETFIEIQTSDEVFLKVEDKPEYAGGMEAMYNYLANNIKYPEQAQRLGVEGRVFVQFIVHKDGSLSGVKTIKGIGAGCDAEAVRVIKNMPNWIPGKQSGQTVKVRMVMPVFFKLDDSDANQKSLS